MWAGPLIGILFGIDMQTGQGDWPAGLLSHAAGTAEDGTFIVSEVWSSRAAQEAFTASRTTCTGARYTVAAPVRSERYLT